METFEELDYTRESQLPATVPYDAMNRSKALFRGFGMTHRCVLVENEEPSLSRLRRLLEKYSEEVEIVGEASDGPSAVEVIHRTRPDLLFLDIDLPGFSGFEVLERLELQPAVIFTTAFNDYALKAFRAFAIDYILKPIDSEALGQALAKLRAMGFNHTQLALAMRQLLEHSEPRYLERVPCKVGDRTLLVKTEEILYFQADNKYTAVWTSSHEGEYLIDTPIVELVKKLSPREFIQIHRGTLVNVARIAETRRSSEGKVLVVLKDKNSTELTVGRNYAGNLKAL
jgi:two-component system LytT family response regulator